LAVPHLGHRAVLTGPAAGVGVAFGSVVVVTSGVAMVVSLGLHASMPSNHVCSNLPSSPHLPNQEPPRRQQLDFPALLAAHLGHTVFSGPAAGVAVIFGGSVVVVTSLGLHVSMPSNHVWSKFLSPGFPHFLNQEPPRRQQLEDLPSLLVPHLGHAELTGPATGVGVAFDSVVVTSEVQGGFSMLHLPSL